MRIWPPRWPDSARLVSKRWNCSGICSAISPIWSASMPGAIRAFCPPHPPGRRRNTLSARYWSARSARPGGTIAALRVAGTGGFPLLRSQRTKPIQPSAAPLAAAAVRFDDPAATWLHIDPYSGAVIEQLDQRRRAVRWAFKLLHSWDWLPLLQRPLLRDGLLLAFSAGALVISLSGVLLGWRRLSRGRGVARCAGRFSRRGCRRRLRCCPARRRVPVRGSAAARRCSASAFQPGGLLTRRQAST